MLESYCRRTFQQYFVDPIANSIVSLGISANQVTIFSLLIGCLSGICMSFASPLITCLLLLTSGYLDVLDGTIARITKTTDPAGAMLDITCDRVVEWIFILGLYTLNPNERGFSCLLMLGSILVVSTSFLLAGIFVKNDSSKSFNYTPDLMERAEAFIFFIGMVLFPDWFLILAYLFTILLLVTAASRFRRTIQQLRHAD